MLCICDDADDVGRSALLSTYAMSDKTLEYYLDYPIPEDVTFEEAIALSQQLLAGLEPLREEAIVETVLPKLLKTRNGARGFFVTFLTHENSLADAPTPSLTKALRSEPDIVAELMVKNLAMSSAMAVLHQRQGNQTNLEGSRRVQARSSTLIRKLDLPEISEKVIALWATLRDNGHEYSAFLDKWKYDEEQRTEICRAIEPLVNLVT